MSRSPWKLTIRDGSDVSHQDFDDLDAAIAAMREQALRIRAKGPLKAAMMLRTFEPADQVRARLQISGRGLFRKPIAGVDVRGNGELMPFRGGVGRELLDTAEHETPFDLVRETLEAERR